MAQNTAPSSSKAGLLELLGQIQSQYGLIVLILVAIVAFACFLFWSLIWRVWSSAMKAKDDEIARLAKERDKYQALVFKKLKSSEIDPPEQANKLKGKRNKDNGNT